SNGIVSSFVSINPRLINNSFSLFSIVKLPYLIIVPAIPNTHNPTKKRQIATTRKMILNVTTNRNVLFNADVGINYSICGPRANTASLINPILPEVEPAINKFFHVTFFVDSVVASSLFSVEDSSFESVEDFPF